MSHFSNEFGKQIGLIHSAMNNLKEIHDQHPEEKYFENYDITKAIEDKKKEILNAFEKIEQLDSKKIILENKANNVLHELEEEFKRLTQKFQRLESFERQLNEHFQNMSRAKKEFLEMFERKQLNKGVIDKIVQSMNWIYKETEEDRKELFDVENELNKSEKMISHLKKYLKKED
ncbi:hypothetical protein K9M74_04465 [Candidatus Woesearchaeota archaeon]|nr:hypothetical protein [Candidatus Woesearchaeota archaeon]